MSIVQSSVGVMPKDDDQRSIQMPQHLYFQDASTPNPIVSPTTTSGGVLTLVIPPKCTWLRIRGLTVALRYGSGSMNASVGNGYVTADAQDWIALPVKNLTTIAVRTTTGADTAIEFFFETLAIA